MLGTDQRLVTYAFKVKSKDTCVNKEREHAVYPELRI